MDSTPPRLVASSPEADAVGVSGRTVRLTFSERIDARSAAQAVTVTPQAAPGEPVPRVEAAGDELVVTLPELRDSTTYVVTVGTALADRRGVKLPAPVTLAFATGDRLDRGVIAGTVRLPTDGMGVAGLTVLAYRVFGDSLPDPRVARPDARTETGADGAFSLGYLADVPHFVAALRDLNRNGRADDGEPFAAPPSPRIRPTVPQPPRLDAMPDSLGAPRTPTATRPTSLDLWLARRDTVPPQIRSVRAVSSQRFVVRFNEGLDLPRTPTPRADVVLGVIGADGDTLTDVADAFPVPGDPRSVEVWARRPVRPGLAVLSVLAADSSGRISTAFSDSFEVPDRADTLRTRLVRFEPSAPDPDSAAVFQAVPEIRGEPWPTVVLSGASGDEVTVISWADPDQTHPPDTLRTTGTLVYPEAKPCPEIVLSDSACEWYVAPRQIEVVGAGRARFEYLGPSERGSISGAFAATSGAPGVAIVELTATDGTRRSAPAPFGTFEFSDLAPGAYAARAWYDIRTSPLISAEEDLFQWFGGSLFPYAPPEPLVILAEPVEVRARWETEIDAALLAPLFDDAAFTSPPDAAPPAPDR